MQPPDGLWRQPPAGLVSVVIESGIDFEIAPVRSRMA